MIDHKDKLNATKKRISVFTQASPKLMNGFASISTVASADGQFSAWQKELIAVAIAVNKCCEDCLYYHISAAKKHGCSREALTESLDVAVEMGGGPALMYAGKALEIFDAI